MKVQVTKMPEVEVRQGTDKWATSKASVLFEVREDGGALRGRFQVSTGGVRWWRGAAQNATGAANWDELVNYLES